MIKILQNHISNRVKFFLNDIEMKKSKTDYDDTKVTLDIRKYVFEHIMWLDEVFANIKRADYTIFDKKSQFCIIDLKIVDYVIDFDDKHSNIIKIIKILKWFICIDVIFARVFIEMCVYYRIWILNFVIFAESIYRLLKKDAEFVWDMKQTETINLLKMILTFSSTLRIINYNELIELIILTVNASVKEWKTILMQIFDDKRYLIRYESEIWNGMKQRYDVIKRKCRNMLKTLKKTRHWLYEIHFVLETNANVLMT